MVSTLSAIVGRMEIRAWEIQFEEIFNVSLQK